MNAFVVDSKTPQYIQTSYVSPVLLFSCSIIFIMIAQLKQGQIDAAMLALPIKEDFLVSKKLFDDEFKLTVATDNPLAKKTARSLQTNYFINSYYCLMKAIACGSRH